MSNTPSLEDLPPRARVGYVLNNATIKVGELTPEMVVTVLRGKGVTIESEAEMRELAADVMRHRGLIGDD